MADIQGLEKDQQLLDKENDSIPWITTSTNETAADGWDPSKVVNPGLSSHHREWHSEWSKTIQLVASNLPLHRGDTWLNTWAFPKKEFVETPEASTSGQ